MIRILKKDLKTFFLFSAILMIPSFLLWALNNSEEYFAAVVFVQLSLAFIITILSVLINEQDEDTSSGYKFYQMLPITKGSITFIKFIFPVLILFLLAIFNRVIYSVFPVESDMLTISDSITLVYATLSLLNSGIIYIGVWLLGYSRFIQFTSGFIAFVVFGSFIFSRLFKYNPDDLSRMVSMAEKWLITESHPLFILTCLFIYLGMGFFANRIEKK